MKYAPHIACVLLTAACVFSGLSLATQSETISEINKIVALKDVTIAANERSIAAQRSIIDTQNETIKLLKAHYGIR